MARVCYGEFDYSEGQPEDRIAGRTGRTAYLQNEFLRAVHELAPEVWEDIYSLRDFFSPLAQAGLTWLVVSGKQPLRVPRKVLVKIDPQQAQAWKQISNPHAYLSAATKALEDWARRWNLNEEWCLQRAYDALRWWTRHGRVNSVLWLGANWGGAVISQPKPDEPPHGLPEYRPLFTFREDYLKVIRASGPRHGLLKSATTYCEQVEQCYERAGYSRCKGDEKRNLQQHLEWTVRFQVRGESLEDIANTTGDAAAGGIEKSTVLRGVNDLLQMIYLAKRADAKRGRRRGSKDDQESKAIRQIRSELGR